MRLHFGEFCFDTDRRELSEGGAPVHLTPKALQLLRLLLDHRPKVISKEEIYAMLWADTFVEESNLSVLVSEVRRALKDEARQPRFVKTAHGFGYGFIGEVRGAMDAGMIRLRSGSRDYELVNGENIVGRDAAARVRLNAPGISRQHARIVVAGHHAIIEDLGSKNGTYVQGRRVEGKQELREGDEIRLSRELLVVLLAQSTKTTLTDL
jgi:DNA-binding winged helix-turn-helix (wHTH) protein